MNTFKRPTTDIHTGSITTTPHAAMMIRLLGGHRQGPVSLSHDEMRSIRKLYGYTVEKPNERPPPPEAPNPNAFASSWEYREALKRHDEALKAHAKWTDPMAFLQAGADRGMFRHAEADGLRLVAYMARFTEPGQDPLQALIGMAIAAGFDVDPADVDYAGCNDDDGEDDAAEAQ